MCPRPHPNQLREKGWKRMSSINPRAASSARQTRERPKPTYIARAKVGTGWVSIGAAWALRSGEAGFSLKLTTVPLNWDGRFVLLLPIESGEDPTPQDE